MAGVSEDKKDPKSLWEIATVEEVNELRKLVYEASRAGGVNAVAIAELSKWMRHELTMRDAEINNLRNQMATSARNFHERIDAAHKRIAASEGVIAASFVRGLRGEE